MSDLVFDWEQNISMAERRRCAAALFVRGFIAPVTHPAMAIGIVTGIVKNRFGRALDMNSVADEGWTAGSIIATGTLSGALTFVTSFVEAPYQLVRSYTPVSKPWTQLHLGF